MSVETGHLFLEFMSFLLALGVAGFGILKLIDKKFETQEMKTTQGFKDVTTKVAGDFKIMWDKVDGNKKESQEVLTLYVRKDLHDKDIQYIKELSEASVRSLLSVLQTEIRFINEKLDKLIKHDDQRNGIK